jgi:hypothetical protein
MIRVRHVREHALVFGLYALVSLATTWPLVRDFATRPVGDVVGDQQHSLWMLWHVKEAVFGRQPWFTANLLYYPHGISTLGDGVGPLTGILALPFWPWGVVAAYNGATLLGLALSGWSMYLLVRYGIRAAQMTEGPAFVPWVAAFAGLVFMLWPIHFAGMYGHIEKIFVGALPLTVLAALLAWDPARSKWWLAAPGVGLLLALLQNGQQFLFAVLALVLLAIDAMVRSRRLARSGVLPRIAAASALAVVIAGPLVWMVARVALDGAMQVAVSTTSPYYTPDVLQFVVPSIHQRIGRVLYPDYNTIVGEHTRTSILASLNGIRDERQWWVGSGIENAATVPYTVLGLMLAAALGRVAGARVWWWFSGLFVLLAMGPWLRVAGQSAFTVFQVPIVLPYAWLTSQPGFSMMRTPARFMMIAAVGLTVLAAMGLAWLALRAPRYARVTCATACLLALLECWPNAWPQQLPPPVPAFYTSLATDPEPCGVLDLPADSAAYMYYQTFHGKPIAWGYLSRLFLVHPVPEVARTRVIDMSQDFAARTRERLSALGYCYVVWHKRPAMSGPHRAEAGVRPLGPSTDARSNQFIRMAFAGETPVADDDLVTVYRLDGAPQNKAAREPAP